MLKFCRKDPNRKHTLIDGSFYMSCKDGLFNTHSIAIVDWNYILIFFFNSEKMLDSNKISYLWFFLSMTFHLLYFHVNCGVNSGKWWFNSLLFNREYKYKSSLSESMESLDPIENSII